MCSTFSHIFSTQCSQYVRGRYSHLLDQENRCFLDNLFCISLKFGLATPVACMHQNFLHPSGTEPLLNIIQCAIPEVIGAGSTACLTNWWDFFIVNGGKNWVFPYFV